MDLDESLREKLETLIAARLGEDLSANISIESISISESKREIHIVVRIETDAKPEAIADRYFGLTGKVRDTLGDKWKKFFPVISPNIASQANA